jgi:hypothetical protein
MFRSHTCRWSDVDRFGVGYVGVNKMVLFNYTPNAPGSAGWRRA